jgi:Family of unknown function (DUF6152)
MKGKLFPTFLLTAGLLMVCGPALAHHGNAAYADKRIVFKQATVTKFAWANPHSLIFFDAKDAKGKVAHWVCETAAPQALRLIGWSKESLAPGDVITIYLYPAKDGNPVGRLNKIVLADGSELHDTQLGSNAGHKTRYNNPSGGPPDGGK